MFANLQSISFLEFNALNADFENIQRLAHISTAATRDPWKRAKFPLKMADFLSVKAILAGCHMISLQTKLKCFGRNIITHFFSVLMFLSPFPPLLVANACKIEN